DELGAFEVVREKKLKCYNGIIGDGWGEWPECQLRKAGVDTYLQEREGAKN
ncbi:7-cyano-7-deazaguanine synthase QueC, partial [Bacillus cereus]|nr:7-cyano-7-deazaguanine synthase QueC [Bacillus cereus]